MSADDAQMQFWGVEVKPGQSLKVDPYTESELYDSTFIHLSQAALGEAKKDRGSEPVVLYVTFGGQKLVLGTLSKDNVPQLSFDLVLEKEFELSHNWKNGSVYFLGYKAHIREFAGGTVEIDDDSEDESEDEDLPLPIKENGQPAAKTEETKPAASGSVQKAGASQKQVKVVDPKKDQEEDSEDDEDDESDDAENKSGSSDEDMLGADSDGDEDSDSDEDDEDTPPVKGNPGKKRPNDSALKTPLPAKKAKSSTPQKTDGKKGVHTATPHPMKKGGKTPNSDSKDQTPKPGGQVSCKSCSKTFTSEAGLQQHTKAKHGGQ